jgi:hypothetical protein
MGELLSDCLGYVNVEGIVLHNNSDFFIGHFRAMRLHAEHDTGIQLSVPQV